MRIPWILDRGNIAYVNVAFADHLYGGSLGVEYYIVWSRFAEIYHALIGRSSEA